MLVSPIIHKLNLVSPCIRVLLYAGDLLVIFRDTPQECPAHLAKINTALLEFEFIVGLSVNKEKIAVLLKGIWPELQKAAVASIGYQVQAKYK